MIHPLSSVGEIAIYIQDSNSKASLPSMVLWPVREVA